jgi:lipooligosaccharide transport system permease protein
MAALGLIRSPWAVLLLPASVLTGVAFATPSAAWAVTLDNQTAMNYPIRFGAVPLMLFSGTFFPITQLPAWVRPLAYATPLWHGVALCRALSLGTVFASAGDAGSAAINAGYLVVLAALGLWWGSRAYRKRLYV